MNLIEAQNLAISLMNHHGLTGWSFEFDKSLRRFGRCNYTNKIISLSMHLTAHNDEPAVKNCILHEIAHALTRGHHHDKVWKAKAIEIGCDGLRCYDAAAVKGESKYIGRCPAGHEHRRHTKPKKGITHSCVKCTPGKRRFNPDAVITWELT